MPIGLRVMFVSLVPPRGGFADQRRLVGQAAIGALRGEHAQSGFGHVEPAFVFGRVMPIEALDERARLGGGRRAW